MAEQKLIRARILANQKARRAELPLPYGVACGASPGIEKTRSSTAVRSCIGPSAATGGARPLTKP